MYNKNCIHQVFYRRITLQFVGLFFSAFGVAITKKANLGISPVSSCANVMNEAFPILSLGMYLTIWNSILFVGQIAILRKRFHMVQWLQIAVSRVFGYCTDICNC